MANWAYVENNEIKEYRDILPKNWRNVSGLNLLVNDLPALRQYGWYPVVQEPETFDENTTYISGYSFWIHDTYVSQNPVLTEYTEEEILQRAEQTRSDFFVHLRHERDTKLTQTDWTQVLDIQEIHTQEWRDSWKLYRQQLRDLPEQYQNATNFVLDSIVWPTQPE